MTIIFTVNTFDDLNQASQSADTAAANSGAFEIDISSDIDLTGALYAINMQSGVTLDITGSDGAGGSFSLHGQSAQRGLFVYSGTVTIENLQLNDMDAQGGNGGGLGGNGGAGGGGIGSTAQGRSFAGSVNGSNGIVAGAAGAGGSSAGQGGSSGGGGGTGERGAGGGGISDGTGFNGIVNGGGHGGFGGGGGGSTGINSQGGAGTRRWPRRRC